ncbi:hypothetical protein CRUP_030107 [Coryphaenoides rupestris]|nr:hypothetical protein CRUP_030107 [Coryphaenoides rupestris]
MATEGGGPLLQVQSSRSTPPGPVLQVQLNNMDHDLSVSAGGAMYCKLDEESSGPGAARRGGPCWPYRQAPPPGPYRLATIFLTVLSLVLLVSLIAMASRQATKVPQTRLPLAPAVSSTTVGAPLVKTPAVTTAGGPVVTTLGALGGCPERWLQFQGSCYFVSRQIADWKAAQLSCVRQGGHLAIIYTAEAQSFLWELLPRGHWNAYWFGLTDQQSEDDWKWVDGTTLIGGFWEVGEPNNHINEDCGYIVKTTNLDRVAVRSWIDAPCEMRLPFICQKVLG